MGGLRIAFTGWACTSGYIARDPIAPRWYLLTAGHCLANSGLLATWSHGGRGVGVAARHAFHEGSYADVGAIDISEAEASSRVYGSTSNDILIVTGASPNSAQTIGSAVCRSGATSGWTCGSIVAADVDVMIRGTLIRHTWWTDFPSGAGDSGAPIVDLQGRVLGVVIATTPTQSLYSTVDWIATEMHLVPCVPETCG
jgi:trypsin